MANLPFYGFAALFGQLGFPRFVAQAALFFLLLLTGGASAYFLAGLLLVEKKNQKLFQFLTALAYSFNPFALIVVWNRFQYPYMFFYALMPLALFLFISGVRKRKFAYVVYFNLACLFLVNF